MKRHWMVLLMVALAATACGDNEPDADSVEAEALDQRPQPQPQAGTEDPEMGEPIEDPGEPANQAAQPDGAANGQAANGAAANRSARQTGSLYTVQVASFVESNTAAALAERLERRGVPVWTTRVEQQGKIYHRVRVGVVPEFSEAKRLGTRIKSEYNWPVWIAPIEDASAVPTQAVEATRSYLAFEGS